MNNIEEKRSGIVTAEARSRLCNDLVGGTPAMQTGGYIKQGSAEDYRDYEARRTGAYLFNGFKRTLGYLTGQVFSKDLHITENSPLENVFEKMKHDIDYQGNNIRTFGQQFFFDGIKDGARWLLVQYPRVMMNEKDEYYDEDDAQWKKRSVAAESEKGWRPYFVSLGYDSVLGGRYEYFGGVKKLTLFRFKETVILKGEIDSQDEEVEQIRVLRPGSWEVWRQGQSGIGDWFLFDQGADSLNEIPVAMWTPGEKIDEWSCIPALEDLAYLNLRHFVATADQNVLMAFVRRPPWFGRGLVQEGESVAFGPGRLVHSNSEYAHLQSVGVDPGSVEAGRGEIKDLEDKMSLYGLMMLTPTLRAAGGKTATQSQQESSETTSQLKEWALSFKDCFDQALKFAGMYEGVPVGQEPELKINTEYSPGMGLEPLTILQAVEKGVMAKEIAFDEFKRRGLVSDAYDWEDVKAMILDDQRSEPGPVGVQGLAERLLGRQ